MNKVSQPINKKQYQGEFLTYFIFFAAAGCFIASLFFPVFLTQGQDIVGYWVLFLGWIGLLFLQFAWYAIPLMLFAVYISNQLPRSAFLLAVLALMVASEAFFFKEVSLREVQLTIVGYGLGFYLWFVSLSCFALGIMRKWFLSGVEVEGKEKNSIKEERMLEVQKRYSLLQPVQPRAGVTKKVILLQPTNETAQDFDSFQDSESSKKMEQAAKSVMPPPLPRLMVLPPPFPTKPPPLPRSTVLPPPLPSIPPMPPSLPRSS